MNQVDTDISAHYQGFCNEEFRWKYTLLNIMTCVINSAQVQLYLKDNHYWPSLKLM